MERTTNPGELVVCGWCARVRADEWVPLDEAVARIGLAAHSARVPRLSHGICDSCAHELRALVAS
jgi:hypothetical protein